mmetsp:Transcript_35701/g.113479  ORF Transcript_35701/g.113479 Transcript_35701/m.113479 type:complete len:704 (-) Transcript_35701:222-2333(-)
MQAASRLVVLFAGVHTVLASQASTNPLAKVLDVLNDLSAKVTKEGEEEQKAYHAYVNWCDDMAKNAKYDVKMTTRAKEDLEAKIGELTSAISVADTKIGELGSTLATAEADLKAATEIREKEVADFKANEAELMDVVETTARAISMLEREMQKHPGSFAQISANQKGLLQTLSALVDAAGFASADRQKLVALVQARQGDDAQEEQPGAPAAAVYESKSGGIIDVLEDMKEKAETQLSELRQAETKAKMNYEMLKQSLDDQIAADTKDMEDEKTAKAAAEESKATAGGDLERTTKELKDNEDYLSTGSKDCMQNAADHDASTKARNEELKILTDVITTLKEKASNAGGETYSFLQLSVASGTSSRIQTRADLAGTEVIALVRRLAKAEHSAALAQLASRISAVMRFGSVGGQDPFAKVKELIQNLITSLEKEAKSEASEKEYCDSEMAKTEAKKTDLTDDISKLTSKLDKSTAHSTQLKAEVKQLQDELAELAKTQSEMDKIRQTSHADYLVAKEDMENGLEGVRASLGMLRDYYASDSASASMLQSGANLPPTHSKASGAGQSIIGFLEVIESDFAATLSKVETQESDEASEYDEMTQKNKITTTQKDMDVKYKTKEIDSLQKTIAELSGDRDNANTELSAVLEYYDKLKERCIAKPESYETRKKRRDEEIAGLKEALSILEDETAFVQRRKHGHMRGSLTPR